MRTIAKTLLAASSALLTLLPGATAQVRAITVGSGAPHSELARAFDGYHGRRPTLRPLPCPTPARGHWRIVENRVWIPGSCERVWVDPVWETRYDACGRVVTVIASPGHWTTVERPGRWEIRRRKVWEPEQRYGIWPRY